MGQTADAKQVKLMMQGEAIKLFTPCQIMDMHYMESLWLTIYLIIMIH